MTGAGKGEGGPSERTGRAQPVPPAVKGSTRCRGGQLPLPGLNRVMAGDAGRFAHPAEAEFSRLLSFYGIRWVYEPTAFAIEWTADGRPTAFFTPDFYLPAQGTYVELTTMRQALVSRKNRKVRRLRELYPNVRVKLLYKRDIARLLAAYAGNPSTPAEAATEVLFTEAEIATRLASLAERMAEDWLAAVLPHGRPLLLATGSGAERTAADLAAALERLGCPVETDRIDVVRYSGRNGAARARVRRPPARPLAGRPVLVVADVVSTGMSLRCLEQWLRRHGCQGWRVCALLDRPAARLVEVTPDWVAFQAPPDLLVGHGLALRRRFSALPHIARLEITA